LQRRPERQVAEDVFPLPPRMSSCAIAGLTPLPPDAGNWGVPEFATWARWRSFAGETVGLFRERIIVQLCAEGRVDDVFIYSMQEPFADPRSRPHSAQRFLA
jgi:hypothetical protein